MKRIHYLIFLWLLQSSCNINPSVMFKASNTKYCEYDSTLVQAEYQIRPGDILAIDIYPENGSRLINNVDETSLNSIKTLSGSETHPQFLVDPDGYAKLPLINQQKLAGLTVRQAEKLIETKLSAFYTQPFVMIKVANRRVMVFTGTGGSGMVVNLVNENMTLIEVLAAAGGITNTGKAENIKIIRGDSKNPKVIKVNLSTIESFQRSDIRVMANDIIYVEPVPRISQEVLVQLAPLVGIVTSLALLYQITSGLR